MKSDKFPEWNEEMVATIASEVKEQIESPYLAKMQRDEHTWTEIVTRKTSDKIEWCKQRECSYRRFGQYWFFEDAAIAAEFVMRWQ